MVRLGLLLAARLRLSLLGRLLGCLLGSLLGLELRVGLVDLRVLGASRLDDAGDDPFVLLEALLDVLGLRIGLTFLVEVLVLLDLPLLVAQSRSLAQNAALCVKFRARRPQSGARAPGRRRPGRPGD